MTPQLSAALPDQVTLQKVIYSYSHPNASGDESYVDLVIEGGGLLNGTFDGYCIDTDRLIDFELDNNGNGQIDADEVGDSYSAKVYSSYEELPPELVGPNLIEKPENLDLLNWIINQDFAGQESPSGGTYSFADVQRAIWALIDDGQSTVGVGPEGNIWTQARVDEIVEAAQANGEGFVPEFGQKMGVLIVPEIDGDGTPDAQVMFAAVELAQLGDRVFEDSNADGIQDAGDTGIAGVTVNLLADSNGDGTIGADEIVATTITDANGDYSFTVVPGEYKVQFEPPEGFNGVSPANQGGNDAIDSDGLITDVVSLAPGESNQTLDSGFYRNASLGDTVFLDADRDDIQDAGEQGVEGVKVTLTGGGADGVIGTADDTTAETTTDANGNYQFDGLNPGEEYKVTFSELPQGYEFTQANAGNDALDSDADPSTGMSQVVTLSSGENNPTLDAGIVAKPASLGNKVFLDADKDGIQDAGEQGVEGVKVTLTGGGADGVIGTQDDTTAETTTDANGNYQFDGLNPGEEYKVTFSELPQGYEFTQANAGNDALDSDANPTTGITQTVKLAPGENNPTLDAGIVAKPASLGDRVWLDTDKDGIQDAGEQGVEGVKVTLTGGGADGVIGTSDDTTAETATDANGNYQFDGLNPGEEYKVTFSELPQGYEFTQANAGNDALDSDANPTTGITQTVKLAPGENNPTLDAGVVAKPASLGDRVWFDTDRDGVQDAGEQGVEGVKVTLTGGGADGVIGTSDDTTATAVTDANGNYQFEGLNAGEEYKVTFSELPQGYEFTQANAGNDALDSDADPATGMTQTVKLAPGENNPTLDAGIVAKPASLGDRVWFDTDRDGVQDAGEKGVEGVRVVLQGGGADGVLGNADDTRAVTTTDANGNYQFDGLTPGEEYRVRFTNLPEGYEFTKPNAVRNDRLDSDANRNGWTQKVTLAPGENNPTLDAGIVTKPAALGDRVWFDTDKDGIQDAGEQGVEGVKVTLTGGGADGKVGTADDTTAVMFTDANGNYRFDNLNAGEEYKVTFSELPQGYSFTQANAADLKEEVVFESSFESAPNRTGFVKAPLEGWKSKDGYLEIHNRGSADGRNHIELNDDAIDYYKDASQIYRHIQTEAGKQYTLTFDYAPRPGYSADVNAMEVRLDGATLLEAKESGTGQSGFNWKTYTVSFEGDGSSKQLEFLSTGKALKYGRGARLDDIKLVSSMGSNDDTVDSDANPNNGMSQTVVLAPGEYNPTIDAGIVKDPDPICAKLVGTTGINEGDKGNYYVKLDEVSDRDRFFTIRIDNGSAKRVDKWAGNQDIMAGGYYDTRRGIGGPLIKKTYGYIPQGRAGDTSDDRIAVGPSDASWDYTIYKNGQIDQGNTVTVKVAAGQSMSDSFQVKTWKERVTVDRDAGNAHGYFEGTEQFSMQVISADADKVCNDHLDISIYDKTHYDFVSPIAIDLNGNGIQTLSVDRGITFDLMNTGEKIQTGWLSGEDGFLAIDNNGNGQIDDRSELFGGSVGEGFAKLSSFDSNGDGWVNAADSQFAQLRIWQDTNENAITDRGELMSLAEAGITDLNTNYAAEFNLDSQGNMLGERSVAISATGQSMEMIDVYFQVAGAEPMSAKVG